MSAPSSVEPKLSGQLRLATFAPQDFNLFEATHPQQLFGVSCYGSPNLPVTATQAPCLAIDTQALVQGLPTCDAWLCDGWTQSGVAGHIHYRTNADWLMGYMVFDEGAATTTLTTSQLESVTQKAYSAMFALMDNQGFPHLLRVWNYIADINVHTMQLERYRQFNAGRQIAFEKHNRTQSASIPAACALGTIGQSAKPQLVIYFMAGKVPAIALENPRQVPAYQYPADYGPRSPLFARASLIPQRTGFVLMISGTASIVGHQSVHLGDVVAQTEETLHNLQAMVDAANAFVEQQQIASQQFSLADLVFKVYVRNPRDTENIRAVIERRIGVPQHILYLQADICREELLVEIEASAGHTTEHYICNA